MTQFRRVGSPGWVAVTSAAILAFSLLTYGSVATAVTPTPPRVGAQPASDLGVPRAGGSAVGVDGGGGATVEDGEAPALAGKPGLAVDRDCGVGTVNPPDAPTKDKPTDGPPAPTVKTDPSRGTGSAGAVAADAGKPGRSPVAVPELRAGGVKAWVKTAADPCSGFQPTVEPPVKRPSTGSSDPVVDHEPAVATCTDGASAPRGGDGGGSPAQSEPRSIEPDGRAEDLPVGFPACVPTGDDNPVSDGSKGRPAVDLPVSRGDDIAAREDAGRPTR